jgi:hypothetical protein
MSQKHIWNELENKSCYYWSLAEPEGGLITPCLSFPRQGLVSVESEWYSLQKNRQGTQRRERESRARW